MPATPWLCRRAQSERCHLSCARSFVVVLCALRVIYLSSP